METPNKITVTIPNQEYSDGKYLGGGTGFNCRCYLEEALAAAGYPDSHTGAVGRTRINGKLYVTQFAFGAGVLKEAFERGEDVTVTLIEN